MITKGTDLARTAPRRTVFGAIALAIPLGIGAVAIAGLAGVLPFASRYAYLLSGVALGLAIFVLLHVLKLRLTELANDRDTAMLSRELPGDIARARALAERR